MLRVHALKLIMILRSEKIVTEEGIQFELAKMLDLPTDQVAERETS